MVNSHFLLTAQWFVLYTHARSERKVHNHLRERGFNSFLPLRTICKKTSEGVRILKLPLFSNYVFVETTPNHLASLVKVPGIARVVSFENKFASISNEEIEAIRRTHQESFKGKSDARVEDTRGKAKNHRQVAIKTATQPDPVIQPYSEVSTIPLEVKVSQVKAA